MKLKTVIPSLGLVAMLALTGCSDNKDQSVKLTSVKLATLNKTERKKLAESLSASDLKGYWNLNPGAREWGIENGRFSEGDQKAELGWAKRHIQYNKNAKWKKA